MRQFFLSLIAMTALMAGASRAVAADGLTQLVATDQQIGSGSVAREGSQVELNYTGWLYDENAKDHHGRKIDSSFDHGQTITFVVGERQVIAGWDKGVRGMHVGGKRTLLIPANLGYGARAVGDLVPPHSPLVFDIELVSVH
ncbi:FKBP-type peptidyl-prolyl cis-trans isomerase [Rhodanobacter sp. L36]|uniref:FKBP-type peptidyl-prolyl cis-trans isomerase n=1 Tax=Rhodanobacter sp. L36 TaxID=1747221 RepID=UPI00131B4351|nr:FKBP-type peptidyl-prolyl cis-trans isomerase [Rhodanobacter sp. L36]